MALSKIRNVKWDAHFYDTDQHIAALLNYIPDAIIISDEAGVICYINTQAITLFGYTEKELINQTIETLVPAKLRKQHIKLREKYNEYPIIREMGRNIKLHARNKSGREIPIDVALSPLQTNHGILSLAMIRDISAKKKTEDYLNELNRHLDHLAHHDPLTELPNRLNFNQCLEREISLSIRHSKLMGLMFLDLDHFKEINDVHGHHIGDRLLIEISRLLKSCLRKEDILARLGGDEFAILLPFIKTPSDTTTIAQKIIAACKQPLIINDIKLEVSASIGIACAPLDATTPEELLKCADIAMYRAKDNGRNNFQLYTKP